MMTESLNYSSSFSIDHGTPAHHSSSGEPSESNIVVDATSSSTTTTSTCSSNINRPDDDTTTGANEPTRGVKKTPSLRRGAAAYAQLLQAAVTASIEAKKERERESGCEDLFPQPPPLPDAMQVENAALESPLRANHKRTRQQAEPSFVKSASPRMVTGRRQRHHSDDEDIMDVS